MGRPAKGNATGKPPERKGEVRCAIYTRKSSEEGLEQDFNSLDAQREACEAYIRSQKSEGWVCLPTLYDDGGISGGTLERPALRRLLTEISEAKIDAVVVYKVDRLTRSLADFAKIVEVFDAKGVSFVSVTQQFNTTTSMGRLTLNMLLSFAQFEREVTGERIRDKIAASKARGMWMGGLPPLGYDVRDRKLIVNEGEAKTVRHIFSRYAELGSVHALKVELDEGGIRSKVRVDRFGRTTGDKPLARGALYLMLQNRLYRGEIVHKGTSYAAEHTPIIDQVQWDTVQAKLAENRVARKLGERADAPSLLAGLLVDGSGDRMSPTHTRNDKGTRYRYYISQGLVKGRRCSAPHGRRVPARDVEELVEARLLAFLRSEAEVIEAISSSDENASEFMSQARDLADRWPGMPPSERRRVFLTLLSRVQLLPSSVEIAFLPERLVPMLGGGEHAAVDSLEVHLNGITANAAPDAGQRSADQGERPVLWSVPARLKRTGIEKRVLIDVAETTARRKPDHSIARLLAQAHQYHAIFMQGSAKTVTQLAKEGNVTRSYFTRVLRLAFLSPEIMKAILRNRHPLALSANRLANEIRLPIDWREQQALLLAPAAPPVATG